MAPSSTHVVVQRRATIVDQSTQLPISSKTGGRQLGTANNQSRLKRRQILTFASLFLGYAIYNLCRKAISYVTPVLMAQRLLTHNQAGLINSSQSAAYALSKFGAGIVSDKLSARALFSIGLLVSGVSTVGLSYIDNYRLWVGLWFLNGLAQGCGWPACSKLIKKWFSTKHFGTCWSLLTASGNVAGAVGPMISAFILMKFDWKISVIFTGLMSVLMAVVTLAALYDAPEDVGLSIEKEEPSVEGKSMSQEEDVQMTWRELLCTPLLCIVATSYLITFGIKTALCDWSQVYLIQELSLPHIQASSFLSWLEFGGFVGGILAGVITDGLSKKSWGYNPRLMVSSFFLLGTSVAMHCMTFIFSHMTSQIVTSTVGFVLGASLFGPISIFGIVASESFPQSVSGRAHAVVALAANGGAIIAGWPFSKMVESFGWRSVLGFMEFGAIVVVFIMYISGPWQTVVKSKKQ